MSDIELKIPIELTAAMIIRRTAEVYVKPVDDAKARELALELHGIIESWRRLKSVAPPGEFVGPPQDRMTIDKIEEPDMVLTLLNTAVLGCEPKDYAAAADQGIWISGQFGIADADELWDRLMRLCDRINGTDWASIRRGPPDTYLG